ncbi:MAG TPA: FHA domain-containing protein, partial [Candidatus Sumerlaeota bacterium]|nr:FHA domain-containing protein [Candidatus Sumerlaeota bacterium]
MNQTLDRAQHSSDDAPCRLVVEEGEQKGMVFPLRDKVVSVGRGPDNVIQIIDPRMSRNHTLFILNGSQWLVRDLGSKNGTLLNGRAIPGDQVLGHGDRIQIGDTVFAFELEPTHDGHVETSSGVRVLDDHGMLVPSQILRMSEKSSGDSTAPLYTMPYAGNRQLGVLYRLLDVTSIVLNLDELLEKIIDLVQETLKPDRSGILLHDERYGILLPRAVRRPPDSTDDIIISNSIITKSVEDEVAIIVSDAPRDARFRASDSIVIQRIHSALCAPLIFNNEVLGVIYLDRRRPSGSFGEEDLKLVAGIAKQSAVAIANACFHSQLLEQHARARELEIARTIQEHLL